MKRIEKGKVSMLLLSLMLSALLVVPSGSIIESASPTITEETQYGPRAPGMEIYFFNDPYSLFNALDNNYVDLMDWPLSYYQYCWAVNNPNIILTSQIRRLDVFQFALNNNYTVSNWLPGVRNPLNDVWFRRAIACLVDKDYYIYVRLTEFGDRIDVPIPYLLNGWWNESVTGDNYPYPFSLYNAAQFLEWDGFTDRDNDGTRNYPIGWPGREDGPNLDPLIFVIRDDLGNAILEASMDLKAWMENLGIPVRTITGPKAVVNHFVKVEPNYHLAAWWEWFPIYEDIITDCLYSGFHSAFYFRGGANFITGVDANGVPNYPLLDQYLDEMLYASTIADMIDACKRVQGFLVRNCITISLWSTKSYYAYRNLCGVVNMEGVGPYNIYTLINAYRVDDPSRPIRVGIYPPPISMNPLYVDHDDERLFLPLQDEAIVKNPYRIFIKQPWQCRDWEAGCWRDPKDGLNKTELTIWLNPDIVWIKPETGCIVKALDPEDIQFSLWYRYQTPDSSDYEAVQDLYCLDTYWYVVYENSTKKGVKAKIKFNRLLSLLGADEKIEKLIKDAFFALYVAPLCEVKNCCWTHLKLPGYLPLPVKKYGAPVKIIEVTIKGEKVPARIEEGKIFVEGRADPGDTVCAAYWARGRGYGYFFDDLTWNTSLYSKGPYYLHEFVYGVGGHAFYRANRHHFMPTPPLGEVDWYWSWVEGPKPRSGCFEIDIYDVVLACIAYGSSGRGIPDPYWFPGADLALASLGEIDIYDVVTICVQYGTKFGPP